MASPKQWAEGCNDLFSFVFLFFSHHVGFCFVVAFDYTFLSLLLLVFSSLYNLLSSSFFSLDFGVERSVDTSSLKAEDVEKRFLALLSHATNLPRSEESKESKKIA